MIRLIIVYSIVFNTISSIANNNCFTTNNNYAQVKGSPKLMPKKQLSVECWIKANKYLNWGAPLSFIYDNAYDESGYSIALYENKLRFMVKTTKMKSQDWNHNPGIKIEYNQWFHFAGVYDGESIKVYYNGELYEAKYTQGDIDWKFTPEYLSIGAFLDSNERNYFDGQIDEVRIWNRAISKDEIVNNMDETLSGNEEGLIAYYNMEGNDKNLIDNSINKLDGTIVNYSSYNRSISGAMVRPEINQIKTLSPSEFEISWKPYSTQTDIDSYFVDISKDKNFNSLLKNYSSLKTTLNKIVIKDIEGGHKYFARVKSFSKSTGYSAYSKTLVIKDFSTSLSLNILSFDEEESNRFKVIDHNLLTGSYISLPYGINSVEINSVLLCEDPNLNGNAIIEIFGPDKKFTYNILQNAKIFFSNIKPGEYKFEVKWGNNNRYFLKNSFTMEVKRRWWQNIWFISIVAIVMIFLISLFIKNFKIIALKKYYAFKELSDTKIEDISNIINNEQKELYSERLEKIMHDEKPYLKTGLSTKQLAEMIDIPHFLLSKLLNDKYGKSFNDYINQFRVDAVIEEFKNNLDNSDILSSISSNCGFNSDATFYRVFKKFTGVTPKEYRKSLLKERGKRR